MADWVQSNGISRVVTVNNYQDPRLRKVAQTDFMDMRNPSDIDLKLLDILLHMTEVFYSGGRVLVHCTHGLHRTGSLITLWIALSLAGGDFRRGVAGPKDLTPETWFNMLTEAWNIWSEGRQLAQASAQDNYRRDYARESWDAMREYWQDMPMDMVEDFINRLARHARGCAQRAESHSTQPTVQSRLSIAAPGPQQSQQSQQSQRSSTASSSSAADYQQLKPTVVLKPRPSSKAPDVIILQPVPKPAAKARPQSEQPKKKPRGSAGVEVPGEPRSEPWQPGVEWQPGDWRCRVCGNHNWRRRGFCNGGGGKCKTTRDQGFEPGDWYCRCGNWNLSQRTTCNRDKCKLPRSVGEQIP